MRADGLRVYLRLATTRVALDSPTMRLGALAHAALARVGADVVLSDEAGAPVKARDDAMSWPLQHDLLLRDLVAGPAVRTAPGRAVVLSSGARTVARAAPGADLPGTTPVLWAAPASCLLDPPATPPAALTLTAADAHRLGAAGAHAASLLAWPLPRELPSAPRRVVVAAAPDSEHEVRAVVEALVSALPARTVVDVLADLPMVVDDVRRAPLHPWRRSRLARSCDLVVVVGRSASTDLVAAEATLAGAAACRVVAAAMCPFVIASPLAALLPAGLELAPIDPDADAESLHLPLSALAGWLGDVSGAASDPGPKES